MKVDTIELMPIPEGSESPSAEMDTLRGIFDQAQRRVQVLEEGREIRATAEGERAIQELEFIVVSARTIQTQIQTLLDAREEWRGDLLEEI